METVVSVLRPVFIIHHRIDVYEIADLGWVAEVCPWDDNSIFKDKSRSEFVAKRHYDDALDVANMEFLPKRDMQYTDAGLYHFERGYIAQYFAIMLLYKRVTNVQFNDGKDFFGRKFAQ